MKITIDSFYNDSKKLFTDNALINADTRLSDIAEMSEDLDLITEFSFGTREFFKKFVKDDEQHIYIYDEQKLLRAVYACLVTNLPKYEYLLKSDTYAETINPLEQFKKQSVYGQVQNTEQYGQKQRTDVFGEKERTDIIGSRVNTNTHGNITENYTLGQQTDTTTNAQRETTGSVTSFSIDTFHPTDKAITGSTQDTTVYGGHTDTKIVTQLDDTTTLGGATDKSTDKTHTDTKTDAQHTDTKTVGQHTDTVTGYNDAFKSVEQLRNYSRNNTANEVVNDVVNAITYGMYLS